MVINEPNVTSIVRPGGMIRSGRVFSPRMVEPLAKDKGKEVATDTLNPTQNIGSQKETYSHRVTSSQKEAE